MQRSWLRLGAVLSVLALPVLPRVWTVLAQSAGAPALGGQSASGQAAGVRLTTIADTIVKADGTPASGSVLVSWPAFVTAGGTGVPAGSTSFTLGAGGALNAKLVPNAGATPMGSYYTVVYHLGAGSGDGGVTQEYWVVPASGGAVTLSAIRSTVLPTSVAAQFVTKNYVDQAVLRRRRGRRRIAPPTC